MEGAICSREFRRDYYWIPCNAVAEFPEKARSLLAPAFEGALSAGRFVVLLRGGRIDRSIVLCISVSTKRKDFIDAPIRTMAFLRAENPDEEQLLASFFAECLRKKDEETLYNPESGVAKAVESLYQTKKTDKFLAFCQSLKPVDGKGGAPENRWAIPRDDVSERKSLADALPAAITGNSSFLFALTDRQPADVLASLGSMFDRGAVWIFSKATSRKERIPEPPQKYGRAATIGGIVVLSILFVAAIGPCSRGCGKGEVARTASTVIRTSGGGSRLGNGETNDSQNRNSAPTNAPTGGTIDATNAPQSRLEIGGSVSNVTIPSVRTETEK